MWLQGNGESKEHSEIVALRLKYLKIKSVFGQCIYLLLGGQLWIIAGFFRLPEPLVSHSMTMSPSTWEIA